MPRRAPAKRKRNPATTSTTTRSRRQREDAIDRRDGRRALEAMRRTGQRPIPHAVVRREAGLS